MLLPPRRPTPGGEPLRVQFVSNLVGGQARRPPFPIAAAWGMLSPQSPRTIRQPPKMNPYGSRNDWCATNCQRPCCHTHTWMKRKRTGFGFPPFWLVSTRATAASTAVFPYSRTSIDS